MAKSSLIDRYNLQKSEIIPSKTFVFIRNMKIIILFVLIANFLFSFSGVYLQFTNYTPVILVDVLNFVYFSLPSIRLDMVKNGDFSLFEKYLVFTVINILVVIFAFISTILCVSSNKTKEDKSFFISYFVFCSAVLAFLFVFMLVFNDAGYQSGRFPIYPNLGKGEFYFLRDTFFYYLICWLAIEVGVMLKIIIRGN